MITRIITYRHGTVPHRRAAPDPPSKTDQPGSPFRPNPGTHPWISIYNPTGSAPWDNT